MTLNAKNTAREKCLHVFTKYLNILTIIFIAILPLYPVAHHFCGLCEVTSTSIFHFAPHGIIFCLVCVFLLTAIPNRHKLYQFVTFSRIRVLLILSLFCVLCTLPANLQSRSDIAISWIYVFGSFYLWHSLLRIWSIPLFGILYIPAFFQEALRHKYDVDLDAHILSEIIGASPQDVEHFLSVSNVFLIVLLLIAGIAFSILVHHVLKQEKRKSCFFIGVSAVALSLFASSTTHKPLWDLKREVNSRAPEAFIIRLHKAYELAHLSQVQIITLADNVPSPAQASCSVKQSAISRGSICLLHIGESVRSDHLSAGGYQRKTTPFLESRQELILYKDCIAVAPFTVTSTFTILTDAKGSMQEIGVDSSLKPTCGGIMDLFHATNFKCYAFVNKQHQNGTPGALYEKLAKSIFFSSADKIIEMPNTDSMSQANQIIEEDFSSTTHNHFILINNNGSHHPYYDYDHAAPSFKPTSSRAYELNPKANPKVAEEVINAYDNTICYLDSFIQKIVRNMQGKPYIYIYVSDHGEYMGEKGVWVRNGNFKTFFSTPACTVPFFILYSPEFEQQNPHFKEALARLREHADMSIGQEHIFHTLLGIFGIQTPYYDEELDLTSDKVKPYTGPHPSRDGKSADGKKWY